MRRNELLPYIAYMLFKFGLMLEFALYEEDPDNVYT
jgi:hypothetical protein